MSAIKKPPVCYRSHYPLDDITFDVAHQIGETEEANQQLPLSSSFTCNTIPIYYFKMKKSVLIISIAALDAASTLIKRDPKSPSHLHLHSPHNHPLSPGHLPYFPPGVMPGTMPPLGMMPLAGTMPPLGMMPLAGTMPPPGMMPLPGTMPPSGAPMTGAGFPTFAPRNMKSQIYSDSSRNLAFSIAHIIVFVLSLSTLLLN
jgi:hypothetical protein